MSVRAQIQALRDRVTDTNCASPADFLELLGIVERVVPADDPKAKGKDKKSADEPKDA